MCNGIPEEKNWKNGMEQIFVHIIKEKSTEKKRQIYTQKEMC